jgi:hypothetical protein
LSIVSHLQALKKKHKDLSEQIEDLERDPSFDSLAVARLKKQKLRLKEELEAKAV